MRPMIAHLRGVIGKHIPGVATIDVSGVGYKVQMPVNDWDSVLDISNVKLFVSTYVREDRFDLYGFLEAGTRMLFEQLIQLNGIGPRMALELCSVPRSLLASAVQQKDPALLTTIKGIGRKSAEKLLVELNSLAENHPEVFSGTEGHALGARFDQDTVAALTQLGFATAEILRALETLPTDLKTTEERVTAALRSL
jgi:holliday junction DNA helicase RuvA